MKYTPRPIALVLTLLLITTAVAAIELGPLGAAGPTDASTQTDPATEPTTPSKASTTEPAGSDDSGSAGTTEDVLARAERIERKEATFSRAPEIEAPTGFLNTGGEGVSIEESIGEKVILVEFWTYSCINCQHTHPYVNGWYEKYEDDGLLVIGVHKPEFEFEKDRANVEAAVDEANIEYPVVIDNDDATWDAYGNHYWPRRYLIGVDGFVRYDHIGEGAYDETDRKIRGLLAERDRVRNASRSAPSR